MSRWGKKQNSFFNKREQTSKHTPKHQFCNTIISGTFQMAIVLSLTSPKRFCWGGSGGVSIQVLWVKAVLPETPWKDGGSFLFSNFQPLDHQGWKLWTNLILWQTGGVVFKSNLIFFFLLKQGSWDGGSVLVLTDFTLRIRSLFRTTAVNF